MRLLVQSSTAIEIAIRVIDAVTIAKAITFRDAVRSNSGVLNLKQPRARQMVVRRFDARHDVAEIRRRERVGRLERRGEIRFRVVAEWTAVRLTRTGCSPCDDLSAPVNALVSRQSSNRQQRCFCLESRLTTWAGSSSDFLQDRIRDECCTCTPC